LRRLGDSKPLPLAQVGVTS